MKKSFLCSSMAAACSVAVLLLAVVRSHGVEVKPKRDTVIQDAEVTKGDVYTRDPVPQRKIIQKTFTHPTSPLFYFRTFAEKEKNMQKLDAAKRHYKGGKIPAYVDIHADINSAQNLEAPVESATTITARGMIVQMTAAAYPLKCEGNLERPPGPPGPPGLPGPPIEFHWEALVKETVPKVELIQTDDNSPLDPKNRMCSNAQEKYKDVEYEIKITPADRYTVTATIEGSAGVTFNNGKKIKVKLKNGQKVKLVAPDDATGTWKLTAECEQHTDCKDQEEEQVFKFVIDINREGHEELGKITTGNGSTSKTGVNNINDSALCVGYPFYGTAWLWTQVKGHYGAATEPEHAYTGNVVADLEYKWYYWWNLQNTKNDTESSVSAYLYIRTTIRSFIVFLTRFLW